MSAGAIDAGPRKIPSAAPSQDAAAGQLSRSVQRSGGRGRQRRRYASSVFCISIATVIGPAPPGTGVIQRGAFARRSEFDIAAQLAVRAAG